MRTPLYEAKVDPDIYFFGFDLTRRRRRKGGTGENPNDDPGWFFVIKERPGRAALRPRQREAADAERLERPVVGRRAAEAAGQLHRDRGRAGGVHARVRRRRRTQEKNTQYARTTKSRLEPRHELGGARLHPVPGARCWSACTPAEMLPKK